MATRKSTLKSTTAPVAEHSAGTNMAPTLWDEKLVHIVADQGFDDKSKSAVMFGTATQRVAAAIYATWLNWVNNGHPDPDVRSVTDLALCVEPGKIGKDAIASLKPMFNQALLGDAPDYDALSLSHDDKAQAKSKRTNDLAAISRSLTAAAIIKRADVTLDMFNVKLGMFAVPPAMLLTADLIGVGMLTDGLPPILLNNRSYSTDKRAGGAGPRVLASIDQLKKAYLSNNNMKASRSSNAGKVKLSDVNPAKLTADCTLENLIRALHGKFVPGKNGKRPAPMPNDLPTEVWNMLADIAQENDAIQESETFRAAVKTGVTPNATVDNTAAA